MASGAEDLQMLRLIRAFQKLTDQDTRQMIICCRGAAGKAEGQAKFTVGCRLSAPAPATSDS